MTVKQTFMEEKDDLKLARMNRILQAAFILFSEKGIDTIAMTDIAAKAEIGVASLYRYYETKEEIAIQTAIWAWQYEKNELLPFLTDEKYVNETGLNQLKIIFDMFIKLFDTQGDFLRFIYFFDSYAVRQQIPYVRLSEYQNIIQSIEEIVEKAISKGLEDNSINIKYKSQKKVLYFTLMHSLFSTSQKLSLSGNLLEMDKLIAKKNELQLLSELLLGSLK